MAQKKASKAADSKSVTMRIVLEAGDDTPTFYANYAEVAFSQHDCVVMVARAPAKLNSAMIEQAKSGVLHLEPSAQIIVPHSLVPALIKAFATARDLYEKQIGPINVRGGKENG